MASFNVINLSLGKIKAGVQLNIKFPYSGVRRVIRMASPCDCSTPINDAANNRIIVKYIPQNISKHLTEIGATEQGIKKVITIIYIDEETGDEQTQLLSFSGVVHN